MDKNAVIIGASGGIGSEIVKSLIIQGYYVFILGRSYSKVEAQLKAFSKSQWSFCPMDLDDLNSIHSNYNVLRKKCKSIDVFINSAGIGIFGSIEDISIEKLTKIFNVNLLGPILLLREIVIDMKKIGKGLIINIESIASVKAFSNGSMYISSKYALAGFSEAIWAELKQNEIQVCSIRPGLINTPFFGDSSKKYEVEDALSSKDIVHVINTVVQQSEYSNISSIEIRPLKKNAQSLFHSIINKEEK